MNALVITSIATFAVLGAVLMAFDAIGWGIALWVIAMSLSQSMFIAEVWNEYRYGGASSPTLYSAVITCLRRST